MGSFLNFFHKIFGYEDVKPVLTNDDKIEEDKNEYNDENTGRVKNTIDSFDSLDENGKKKIIEEIFKHHTIESDGKNTFNIYPYPGGFTSIEFKDPSEDAKPNDKDEIINLIKDELDKINKRNGRRIAKLESRISIIEANIKDSNNKRKRHHTKKRKSNHEIERKETLSERA